MRILAVMLLLSGCATTPPETPVPPPQEPVNQTALQDIWQTEVMQDAAILLAIRPVLTGPAPALSLYDSATTGLTSLAGQPTAKDVDTFKGYVEKPDESRQILEKLRAEKIALDKKTDALEAKVEKERQDRIKETARADAAEKASKQAAIEARKAEAVGMLTKVGAGAVAVGVLALLFGSWLNISKSTAGIVIAAGLGVAVAAPWLIDLAELRYIIAILAGLLAMDLGWYIVAKTWRLLRREKDQAP